MNFSRSRPFSNNKLKEDHANLWSRIRIVNSETESSKIVSKILAKGEPIAVDIEVQHNH